MDQGITQQFPDTDSNPGDDFYQFVNGGWMRTTEIPPDRSSWGSFHELSRDTDNKVLQILEEELTIPGPAANKAARLFESGMDIQTIEKAKLDGIKDLLQLVDNIESHTDLPVVLGKLAAKGIAAFIKFSVHPDLGNSKVYTAYIEPADLVLPEREYYLEYDEKSHRIRNEYARYIEKILVEEAKIPEERADSIAWEIVHFETGLASDMITKEERRQMDRIYNPHTKNQLVEELCPDLNWQFYFDQMSINIPENVIVTEPLYCRSFNTLSYSHSLDTIKSYLTFLLIHKAGPYAHKSLESAHFQLFMKTIEGTEEMRPRKERMVKVVNQSLGELLGQLFITKHFPPEAKTTALEMTSDIISAFHNRISQLSWMNESTKKYALEKLAAFRIKIGYPDKWKEYDSLEIKGIDQEGSYLENILSVASWNHKRDLARIGSEVNREEWFMAPQTVNAYYNPMFNEIVFPAAILQPPFFNWQADAAVNYGGIGAVIGHEITHGFDDQGSRFDKEGNLSEWWTPEDRERFTQQTKKLIDQFDAYFPFEDLPLNGTFTLGENIADLGGLSVAYDALQLYYSRHGRPDPVDGFTAEQRFFMSWATVWRTKIRPEALRNQIMTDPHPPGQYRAVAAPSNMDSFYQAFDILPGSKWYRNEGDRIKIW